MSWNSIVGQARVKEILREHLRTGRIAHAYLLTGPEGAGQDPLALEFSRVLVCEQSDTDACGTCRSCRTSAVLQHPNVNLVFPLPVGRNEKSGDPPLAKLSEADIAAVREQLRLKAENPYHKITVARANAIKINSIREIRREASLTGFEAGWKIFLVMDAEYLNDESSNALLKTLEEPPRDTILLLTSAAPDQLLPTIVSRCQHLRLGPLEVQEIRSALEEREGIPARDALDIARLANGSYARALLRMHADFPAQRREATDFLRSALAGAREETGHTIERIIQRYQKQEIEEFLVLLEACLRDAMMQQEGIAQTGGPDEADSLRGFFEQHPGMNIAAALGAVERAVSLVSKNVYIPLILLNLAFSLRESINPAGERDESTPRRNSTSRLSKGFHE
jgi:DNA polymerase III subunit delta'